MAQGARLGTVVMFVRDLDRSVDFYVDLLGLQVHLNQVVLDITAQSGPGNLLGNLLCSVANLLNGPSLLQGEVSSLLNILQQLLGTPALLGL